MGNSLINGKSENRPVTASARIKAKKGRIDEFEEWVDDIIHESLKFEGHMGVSIIRRPNPANPEYIIIIRFNKYQNWQNGKTRKYRENGLRKAKM